LTQAIGGHHGHAPPLGEIDLRFGSNAVRLTRRDWLVAAMLVVAAFILTPHAWEYMEPLPQGPDVRMPYDLSNDYWLFSRYCGRAAQRGQVIVLGDSVIWGEYVLHDQTLTHYLNAEAGEERYANLGLDGTYPVALAGLVEHYGGAIAGRDVVLHCNLLWTADARHDLRSTKDEPINHTALLPQFTPWIPAYKEDLSRRIGTVVGRNLPFFGWADHLKLAYYDKKDLASWTMEHPYENPLGPIQPRRAPPKETLQHEAAPWTTRGIERQEFAWVDLAESLQWRFFRQTVETLRRRGNRVFVVVGPFNEHMLTPESLSVYQNRKVAVAAWLTENNVPHVVAAVLPTEFYADASHPLAEGYAAMAKQLMAAEGFFRGGN
jgi:hypothetical protein